jgi:hypothetical protein
VFIGSNGQNFRQYNFYVEDERSAIGWRVLSSGI